MRVTTGQLHSWVWALPTQQLARYFNISDSALAKTCRNLQIPKPGRGFWRRCEVGQSCEVIPFSGPADGYTGLQIDDEAFRQLEEQRARAESARQLADRAAPARPASRPRKNAEVSVRQSAAQVADHRPNEGVSQVRLPDSLEVRNLVKEVAEAEALLHFVSTVIDRANLTPGGEAVLAVILSSVREELLKRHRGHELAVLCEAIAQGECRPAWWSDLARSRTASR